jgi:beta-glucosidase
MADIDALIESLTLEEKAALTAGEDFFSLVGLPRLGIPKVRVTDGPSGARGDSFPGIGGPPSTCIPCGSAIGASWDPALARDLGDLVGREALDRGCRGILAPTVNLHRSPLAGRNFECYSEDPFLSGKLAAGYVRGVQAQGVFATVKHFVGNDAEYERNSMSSVIDERSLRELYLLPFELAVREGGALGIMTSYNRLNGRWLTEQARYLTDILREEWGFEGLVMTDWFAVANAAESLSAGLDLEMPGPGRSLGSKVLESIQTGLVDEKDLDQAVRRLLGGLDRIGALDAPTQPIEPKPPSEADLALVRRAASEAVVLLTNDGTLPLSTGGMTRVAVLGAHARRAEMVGGGSAGVIAHRPVNFHGALAGALDNNIELIHERGCEVDLSATVIGTEVLRAPEGFVAEIFQGDRPEGPVLQSRPLDELRIMVLGSRSLGYPEGPWSMRVKGTVLAEESGRFLLSLAQSGRARVYVDGDLLLDGVTNPPPSGGTDFFGMASKDLTAEVELTEGESYEFVVEYTKGDALMAGFNVGFRTTDQDALLDRAVNAAQVSDAAIVFVGTTHEWETEGRDRATFDLPGRQEELIRRVVAANPRTVVVVNAAAPVAMSWADEPAAVLQCWFGGQEMDHGVADVLLGRAEPGGRLPTTVPERIEHNPSYDNFPGENGELRYGEGLYMGYRGYEHRRIPPRFAFGHGLSYTIFDVGEPMLPTDGFRPGETLTVTVPVTNTGSRPGSHVVQCYVRPPASRLARPPKELKAFAKVHLDPGSTAPVELVLNDRSFSYWDPGQPDYDEIRARQPIGFLPGQNQTNGPRQAGWQVESGDYDLLIGNASDDIRHRLVIHVSDR